MKLLSTLAVLMCVCGFAQADFNVANIEITATAGGVVVTSESFLPASGSSPLATLDIEADVPGPKPFDLELTVTRLAGHTGGVTVFLDELITNSTDFAWSDHRMLLGHGLGENFVPGAGTPGLVFASSPVSLDRKYSLSASSSPTELIWNPTAGPLAVGDTVHFGIGINVPAALFVGDVAVFTLRQMPEPSSLMGWAAMACTALVCVRRRRAS